MRLLQNIVYPDCLIDLAYAFLQLLGFPVQLVGLLALPYLGIRWFVDGQDAGKDIEEYAVSMHTLIPCWKGRILSVDGSATREQQHELCRAFCLNFACIPTVASARALAWLRDAIVQCLKSFLTLLLCVTGEDCEQAAWPGEEVSKASSILQKLHAAVFSASCSMPAMIRQSCGSQSAARALTVG